MTAAVEQCSLDHAACAQDCRAGYNACIRSGTCFPQITCALCDDAYEGCRNACPTCPCQPTSTTEEREDLYLQGWGSLQCLSGPFGTHLYRQDFYSHCTSTVKVTENCDGTTTEEILWSSCEPVTCWSDTGTACSFSMGTAPYSCY
ncbi:MAG TPA: hypothetical protein VHQ65_01490 [Thermoanaerobaculia bacterium]|nr:hypothetical protein [Thermoanaerobaculia bacterium]